MIVKESFITNSSSTSYILKPSNFTTSEILKIFIDHFFEVIDDNELHHDKDNINKNKIYEFLNNNKKFDNPLFISRSDISFGDNDIIIFKFNNYMLMELPLNLLIDNYNDNIDSKIKHIEFRHECYEDQSLSFISLDPRIRRIRFYDIIKGRNIDGNNVLGNSFYDLDDLRETNEELKKLPELRKELEEELKNTKPLWKLGPLKSSKTSPNKVQDLKDEIKRLECILFMRKLLKSNYII